MPESSAPSVVGPETAQEIGWTHVSAHAAAGESMSCAVQAGPCNWSRRSRCRSQAGEFIAILGRNGCGKSLTLHTLAGLRQPAAGEVRLGGVAGSARSSGARLPAPGAAATGSRGCLRHHARDGTHRAPSAPETLAAGTARTGALARAALASVDLADFARASDRYPLGRRAAARGDGRAARAAAARLSCSMSRPTTWTRTTSSRCCTIFRALADAGSAVIATLHDPTLAERFADRVLLMHRRWPLAARAMPRQCSTPQALSRALPHADAGAAAPGRARVHPRISAAARRRAAGRCWRAPWWYRASIGAPVESGERAARFAHDHASAAMSRIFTSDSITTSSAPRASRW